MSKKKARQGRKSGSADRQNDRDLKVRVKTAKGRRLSSTRWLERQLNDPFVKAAKEAGYRSRAAFKLAEIDDRFGILKPKMRVLDLGAAPGGWSQIAAQRCKSEPGQETIIGIDISEIEAIPGVVLAQLDFMDQDAPEKIGSLVGAVKLDVVMSDMAAPASGHKQTDHLRVIGLCEAAFDFARQMLLPDGTFIAKVFQGGTEGQLLRELKAQFTDVRHVKPKSSRAESPEQYVLARGFRR